MIINPYRFSAAGGFDGFGNASRAFDGTNDYIDIGDVLDSVTSGTGAVFTLALWVKSTSLDDGICFSKVEATVSNSRSYFLRVLSTGELGCILYGDGNSTKRFGRQTSTSGSISASTWHHVAIIYDQSSTGDYLRMFIDGVEDTSLTDYFSNGTFVSIYDGTAPVQISGYQEGDFAWGGNLADVRIYDADIGATEIANLAVGTDYQTNLVGWWLDDDDDVLDNAGSNDGTNNGSTYSTDGPAD